MPESSPNKSASIIELTEKIEDDWGEIIWSIIDEAEALFKICHADSDFCIQNITGTNIVFGGTNRVIWSARSGFNPDRSYCTKRFLEKWDMNK